MKNIIKLIVLAIFVVFPNVTLADPIVPSASSVQPVADYAQTYKTTSENLLYLLLSAINEHNYSIEEIQFKTGSVLFKAYTKEFLASVSAKDGYNAFIKIVPADNNYNFSPSLIQKLHSYIEANYNISFQKIL